MRSIQWLGFSMALALGVLGADRTTGASSEPLRQPPTAAGQVSRAASPTAASSKVWIGRYAEYEEFLRTAVIDRTRGTTRRVFFEPGGLAAAGAIDALFTRRDNLVRALEQLAAQRGASQVFTR